MLRFFSPGEIIVFDIKAKQYTSDGLATGGTIGCSESELCIYEQIDLESFPSCRDFLGGNTKIRHGQYGIVIRHVGRPDAINQKSDMWQLYDIYEVYTSRFTKRQIFRFNLMLPAKFQLLSQ